MGTQHTWKAELLTLWYSGLVALFIGALVSRDAHPGPLFWGIVAWVVCWALMRGASEHSSPRSERRHEGH